MVLGMNQVKLALVVALAQAGGTASTRSLVEATGVGKVTALRHLRQMATAGYVSPSAPVREGKEAIWVLDHASLKADLSAFLIVATPRESGLRDV